MTENNQAVAVATQQTAISRFSAEEIMANTIAENTELPKLADAQVSPMPLDVSYLKVKEMKQGDSINGFVWGVFDSTIVDPRTAEMKVLPCLFFLQEKPDGTYEKVQTASKALVGKVQVMIENGEIIPRNRMFPVRIVYDGIKQGAKNDYASWRIYPIIIGG